MEREYRLRHDRVTSGNPGTATCTTPAFEPASGDRCDYGDLLGRQQPQRQQRVRRTSVQGGIATTIDVTSVSPVSEDYGSTAPVTITAVLAWTGHGVAPTASDVTIGGSGFSWRLTGRRVARLACTKPSPVRRLTLRVARMRRAATRLRQPSRETPTTGRRAARSRTTSPSSGRPRARALFPHAEPVDLRDAGNVHGNRSLARMERSRAEGSQRRKPQVISRNGDVEHEYGLQCEHCVAGYPGIATCTTSSRASSLEWGAIRSRRPTRVTQPQRQLRFGGSGGYG